MEKSGRPLSRTSTPCAELASAIEQIGSEHSVDAILARLLDAVACLEQPPASWILLPSAESDTVYTVVRATGYPTPPLGETVELPPPSGAHPAAAAPIGPASQHFTIFAMSFAPCLVLPLSRDGKTIAVLCVAEKPGQGSYPESSVARLRLLATFAAMALANNDLTSSLDRLSGQLQERVDTQTRTLLADNDRLRRLHEQAERLATVDGLTGLYNHRYFWQRLTEELARAKRFGPPFTVLFMDVDGLKKVNDHYGHLVGDKLLRKMGELVAGATRSCDVAARHGGDEFAVLLIETGRDGAGTAAGRLRQHSGSVFVAGEQEQLVPVRFSLGIASFPDDGASEWELVHAADQAAYRQKRTREKTE